VSRSLHRLSSAKVVNAKPRKASDGSLKTKLYADGGGLYLQVTPSASGVAKSWIFRFSHGGKERYMGLGALDVVGLAAARAKAVECRKQNHEGVDPISARRVKKATVSVMTFDQCKTAYIDAHRATWKHPNHVSQWQNSLANYASPVIGNLPVDVIDLKLVMQVIEPIWQTKNTTADRVRSRIESILDWAATREMRSAENPARWRGRIENLLPRPSKVWTIQNYPALHYDDIPGFIKKLRGLEFRHALTLEFTILTVARTTEVLGAQWSEIDMKERLWTIPPHRMKGGKEHRVPLTERPMAILLQLIAKQENGHVFPGERTAQAASTVMREALHRLGYDKLTVHGFRSTFSDWVAECTDFPDWVADKALAHLVGDETKRAYQRGDLLEKRRLLMDAWGTYCEKPTTV
jgi:integrase